MIISKKHLKLLSSLKIEEFIKFSTKAFITLPRAKKLFKVEWVVAGSVMLWLFKSFSSHVAIYDLQVKQMWVGWVFPSF